MSSFVKESKRKTSRHSSSASIDYEQIFLYRFKQQCVKNKLEPTPILTCINQNVGKPRQLMTKHGEIILYKDPDSNTEMIIVKNWNVPEAILITIGQSLDYSNIRILKLEFCNLHEGHVSILETILLNNINIMELNLSGNPLLRSFLHDIINTGNLNYISMRFCQIDSEDTKRIFSVLKTFNSSRVLYLNLSTNNINDGGCIYIAEVLRINRSLLSLNLADNKITDVGCEIIASAFKTFQLTPEEIFEKRKAKFNFLKTVDSKTNTGKELTKKSSRTSTKKIKSRSIIKDRSSTTTQSSTRSSKASLNVLETKVCQHPFVIDSYEENSNIYCKGNNSMNHLNLSYNKIGEIGITYILSAVLHQKEEFKARGLTEVLLEGNDCKSDCSQLQSINEILSTKCGESLEGLQKLASKTRRHSQKI